MTSRLRLIAGVAVLALLMTSSVGALAAPNHRTTTVEGGFSVSVDDPVFTDLAAFLAAIGATQETIVQVADALLALPPDSVEFINPFTGAVQESQPDYLDPLLTATSELVIPNVAELAATGGPLAPGPGPLGEVFYGQGLIQPTGEEWYLYAKVFANPCAPTGVREYGVVGFDSTPLKGGNPARYEPAGTANLYYGSNFAYVLHSDPQNPAYTAFRYQYGSPGPQNFNLTDSSWMGICFGNTVIGLIPGDEWDGTTDIRFFSYGIPFRNGQAQANDAAQMRAPGIDLDSQPVDALGVIQVGGPQVTEGPTSQPTVQPTAASATDSIPTSEPTATAIAAAQSPPPVPSPTSQPLPSPSVPPTSAPTIPISQTVGGGIDPLVLLLLLGLGLIGLSILLLLLSRTDTSCDELATAARVAQDECDKARASAGEARARQQTAARDLSAAQQHETAARASLDDAKKALDHAKLPDDLDVQNEANAEARAEADAAKADARQAWKDAGSRQGASAARLDTQLADIERALQGKLAHNNDPRNIAELREAAAGKAEPLLEPLETALAAARASLDEATASVGSATEADAAASRELSAAEEHADRVCTAAAAARMQYVQCLQKASSAAAKDKAVTPRDDGTTTSGTPDATRRAVAAGAASAVASDKARLSKPPARPCTEGDESWEPEGPQHTFLVRADGPATRVILWTEPGINGMEKWINGSATAAGRRDNEHHPSITSSEIDLISNQRLGQWFAGLRRSGAASNIDVGFEIECVSRSVQCQRRWVCAGGGWVETADRRADVQNSGKSTRSLNEADMTPSTNAMRGFLNKAKKMVEELEQADAEAEKAARCE